MNKYIISRFKKALAAIPPPGVGCHPALLGVSNLGVMSGFSDLEIFREIRISIPSGKRTVPDSEIMAAINRAKTDTEPFNPPGSGKSHEMRYKALPSIKDDIDWLEWRDGLIRQSDGATDADLWRLSPVKRTWPIGHLDAVAFLDALYDPDELLFVGDNRTPGIIGRSIRITKEWTGRFEKDIISSPKFIINPLTGYKAEKQSGNGTTLRGDSNVSAYRFMLIEFDELPLADQVAFWTSVISEQLMPVSALYFSGKKSIHALINVNLSNKATWDSIVKLKAYGQNGILTKCGADKACCNPARLSRLPGYFRDGVCQRLLYLKPQMLQV